MFVQQNQTLKVNWIWYRSWCQRPAAISEICSNDPLKISNTPEVCSLDCSSFSFSSLVSFARSESHRILPSLHETDESASVCLSRSLSLSLTSRSEPSNPTAHIFFTKNKVALGSRGVQDLRRHQTLNSYSNDPFITAAAALWTILSLILTEKEINS